MPELTDEQAATLRRYLLDGFGLASDSEGYAAALLEEVIRDKAGDEPSVWIGDSEGNGRWLPPEETGLDWNDAFTGAVLTSAAAENRHMWDRLQARLREQFERGEDPPGWLLKWAAEAFARFRQPNSGPGSGKGRNRTSAGRDERIAVVSNLLCCQGWSRQQARKWIAECFRELGSGAEAIRKAEDRGRN